MILMSFNQWWDALSPAHQVFWFISIIFSVLFFIQLVLLLIGFDSDRSGGYDHDRDTTAFENEFSALSLKSIIAFFMFFGWTGVLIMGNQLSVWIAVLSATIAGLAAMFIVAYLIYKYAQLEQSGTLNLYQALDQPGEVYLPVPPRQSGRGKVHLLIEGRIMEVDAMTDGDAINTGTPVRVVEIMDGNALKVEEIQEVSKPSTNLLK
jgi:hypothetical protein